MSYTYNIMEKVRETVSSRGLLKKGEHIVIGLSGGPDSVCLFDILMKLSEEMDLTVHPVHINHMFRPGEAERDQAFVEDLCRRRGLSCTVIKEDCGRLARELHITSEEAGRRVRYDAFHDEAEAVRERYGCSQGDVRIAVAHNMDDQAETILFRLIRGKGTDGLSGIAYSRYERGYLVVRPVLDLSREEIERYCGEEGLDPVTDNTNLREIYTRNRLRLSLIPLLEREYNENMKAALVRLGRIAATDSDFILKETAKAYSSMVMEEDDERVVFPREELAACHDAVRHRIIFRAFGRTGLERDISEERIEAADYIISKKQAPKTVQFPRGYAVKVAKGRVLVGKEAAFVKTP